MFPAMDKINFGQLICSCVINVSLLYLQPRPYGNEVLWPSLDGMILKRLKLFMFFRANGTVSALG